MKGGRRESNSPLQRHKLTYCHYTTSAIFSCKSEWYKNIVRALAKKIRFYLGDGETPMLL